MRRSRRRRRSRASRRARRRRRRRAGTGRRAGCGRRPGRRRPRARASRRRAGRARRAARGAARGSPRRSSERFEWTSRNGRCESAERAIAPTPRCDRADEQADAAPSRRGTTTAADERRRPCGPGRGRATASPSPTGSAATAITSRASDRTFAATGCTKSTIRGPQREATSSLTRDDAAVLDRRDRAPARPRLRPSPPSGRSTSCRRARSGPGSPRRCTRPRASGSRSRVLSAASAMLLQAEQRVDAADERLRRRRVVGRARARGRR